MWRKRARHDMQNTKYMKSACVSRFSSHGGPASTCKKHCVILKSDFCPLCEQNKKQKQKRAADWCACLRMHHPKRHHPRGYAAIKHDGFYSCQQFDSAECKAERYIVCDFFMSKGLVTDYSKSDPSKWVYRDFFILPCMYHVYVPPRAWWDLQESERHYLEKKKMFCFCGDYG